ncbi:DUF202 domain-containing protein [Streptomyces griseoflavus]|uniref:DUF202 domain-containing protein n=1 Tax=Streptomyces griseoflavus TaxID=35619 RepID=UPI0005928E1F|nr:DUF202 domain-containing protein [Streptomyces griseoflavus]
MSGTAERDPGLQPERTRLAWRRTTLSATVVTVLALRTALGGGASVVAVVACALCCVCWFLFLRVAHRRIRGLAGVSVPGALAPGYAVVAAVCAVGMAGWGAVLVGVG